LTLAQERWGIAFIDKGKLIYYGAKTIKKRSFPHKTLKEARNIVLRLIKGLKPNNLAVGESNPHCYIGS